MKKLLKKIEEDIVTRHNNLRFRCNEMITLALRADVPQIEKHVFLRSLFDFELIAVKEILDRIENECFLDITNDLNIRKLI
jgi:hypothetical protein